MLADATVIALHRLLAAHFGGTPTNTAPTAAKLHLVHSVSGGDVQKVTITPERTNEHQTLSIRSGRG